jgi:hypothetical protein
MSETFLMDRYKMAEKQRQDNSVQERLMQMRNKAWRTSSFVLMCLASFALSGELHSLQCGQSHQRSAHDYYAKEEDVVPQNSDKKDWDNPLDLADETEINGEQIQFYGSLTSSKPHNMNN